VFFGREEPVLKQEIINFDLNICDHMILCTLFDLSVLHGRVNTR
jgi:hypothetical protein